MPIRQIAPRERRSAHLTVSMDLSTLLTNYFDTKPELKERRDILIAKTLSLLEEANNNSEQNQLS